MRDLTNEQLSIRDLTRDFVRKEIAPFAAEWDRTSTVPLDTLRKAGALGLFGLGAPAEWGGSGADFVSYILMTEELAYGDLAIALHLLTPRLFTIPLLAVGSEAQKARWLPRFAGPDFAVGTAALVEPRWDFDAASLATRASRRSILPELGMMDPTPFGSRRNPFRKAIRSSSRRRSASSVRIAVSLE